MGLAGKSLNVLVPMYGGMGACNFFESFTRLVILMMKYGVPFSYTFTTNESLIPRARNRLVDQYLKMHEETHALLVDADIGFRAEDVLALLEMDLDIVGAACTKKAIRWDRVQQLCRRNGQQYTGAQMAEISGDFVFNFEKFDGQRTLDTRELQEMRNLGTGLLMVKRGVFEKFRAAYPDRWYESRGDANALPGPVHDFFRCGINPETREYDSEDYWFCVDAKAIGFKVMMAPWMRTTHKGTLDFVANMAAVAAANLQL